MVFIHVKQIYLAFVSCLTDFFSVCQVSKTILNVVFSPKWAKQLKRKHVLQ